MKKILGLLLGISLLLSTTTSCTDLLQETEKATATTTSYSYQYTENETTKSSAFKTYSSTSKAIQETIETTKKVNNKTTAKKITLSSIPDYSSSAYITLNNNKPDFSQSELSSKGYERYSSLDSLGRCGVALASCGKDTMPKTNEKRGSISSIYPSGWVQAQYKGISGGYLWNRCHLIGWQLSAENANSKNLITGTRYMNIEGMLPFENMVADYIKETGNHVAYRVTPMFDGNDLVCRGVQMEAYSVEDDGDGICFNVFCYNVQPGIKIYYDTGKSTGTTNKIQAKKTTTTTKKQSDESNAVMVWIPNTGSKYHSYSGCSGMKNPKKVSKSQAENMGYEPCKKCW